MPIRAAISMPTASALTTGLVSVVDENLATSCRSPLVRRAFGRAPPMLCRGWPQLPGPRGWYPCLDERGDGNQLLKRRRLTSSHVIASG